ncbi:MAG: hypothetical protein MK078_13015 [Crocinitomicaceae bacterium]|nr:hypothetical protein [Crocinitomicaceae bacterium]
MDLEGDKKYISHLLNTRSVLKQDVYKRTKEWFAILKSELHEIVEELRENVPDPRIRLRMEDKSDAEVRLYIGSDVIVFAMHTNVFKFSDSDYASQTSYVQDNPLNAYCGVIQVYNFLADSYEFNRPNDIGYLIGRLFINREDHFLMEGKQQLGFLYRDFMHQELTSDKLHEIANKVAIAAIDFELLTPPYQAVEKTTVHHLQTLSHSSELKTGKRLGFKFSSETDVRG